MSDFLGYVWAETECTSRQLQGKYEINGLSEEGMAQNRTGMRERQRKRRVVNENDCPGIALRADEA